MNKNDEKLIESAAEIIVKSWEWKGTWAFRLSKWFGGNKDVWFQRLHMIGISRNYSYSCKVDESPVRSSLRYIKIAFYYFAFCLNFVHPEIQYGGGEPMPWKGISIYWGPQATGKPGQILWRRKYLLEISRR